MSTHLTLPSHAELPAVYRAAQKALATCTKIDECRNWADKAKAVASYAKQANDETLHRYADRIKARAIRRCGELAKKIEPKRGGDRRSKGGRPPIDSRLAAANGAGLSPHQLKQAIRVANVPEDAFERQLESEHPPTVTELAAQGKTRRQRTFEQMRGTATAQEYHAAGEAIGSLEDFAKFARKVSFAAVVRGIQSAEIKRTVRAAVCVLEWVTAFIQTIKEKST